MTRIGENLILRDTQAGGRVAYARWRHGGRTLWQKAPIQGQRRGRQSGAWEVGEDGQPQATARLVEWLTQWQNDVCAGRWAQAHATRERSEYPSLSRLLAVYGEIAAVQFRLYDAPRPATAADCAARLSLIASGCGVAPTASCALLTPSAVLRWVEGRVSAGTDPRRARFSAWRTVGQARAVWAAWTIEPYRERGIEIPPALREWPRPPRGAVRSPRPTDPPDELKRATLAAWRALEQENPPLWLAASLLFVCGMRPVDARELQWTAFRESDGTQTLTYEPSKTRNSAGDPRVVTLRLPPGVWERFRAANPAAGYVLPATSATDRADLLKRDLNAWMRAIGWDKGTYRKGAYQLRRLFASLARAAHGIEWAAALIGDNPETALKHYAYAIGSQRPTVDPASLIDALPPARG